MNDMDKPTPPLTRAPRPQWMSDMSLRLIDARTEHHCRAYHNHNVEQTLTKAVTNSFMVDTCRRAEVAAE